MSLQLTKCSYPDSAEDPCMVYLPTIYYNNQSDLGKNTIHGSYGIYIYRNIEQSNEIGRTEGQQIYMMMTTFVKYIIIFKTCILFVHMFNVKKSMETPATLPASIYRTDRVPILPFSQALPSAHALWRQIVPMRHATLSWTLKKYI